MLQPTDLLFASDTLHFVADLQVFAVGPTDQPALRTLVMAVGTCLLCDCSVC